MSVEGPPVLLMLAPVMLVWPFPDSQNPLVVLITHPRANFREGREPDRQCVKLVTYFGVSPEPSSSWVTRSPQSRLEIFPVRPPCPHQPPVISTNEAPYST